MRAVTTRSGAKADRHRDEQREIQARAKDAQRHDLPQERRRRNGNPLHDDQPQRPVERVRRMFSEPQIDDVKFARETHEGRRPRLETEDAVVNVSVEIETAQRRGPQRDASCKTASPKPATARETLLR